MNDLKDTVDLMMSDNYKDRFKAEYYQTKIRYEKLHTMIVKYEADTLAFEPTCELHLYKRQASNMRSYLYDLEVRAEIEGIMNDLIITAFVLLFTGTMAAFFTYMLGSLYKFINCSR